MLSTPAARPKENAPQEAGHYLKLGGPGRNRLGSRISDSVSRLSTHTNQIGLLSRPSQCGVSPIA